jgi:hypothetical protein
MSVRTTTPESDQCAFPDCSEEFRIPNAVAGSYCSTECRDRHEGRRLLRHVRQDHTVCWSCWRRRKEIERPTDAARRGLDPVTDQALVGFEYLTEHADHGKHGVECECGAVDHDIPDYDRRDDVPYHWLLYRYLEATRDEGQHDRDLDLATFADVLWESEDLELAVGRALE